MVEEGRSVSVERLWEEVCAIYRSDPSGAESSIEGHLQERLEGLSLAGRRSVLEELVRRSASPAVPSRSEPVFVGMELSRFCSLFLGRTVAPADLATAETAERLAQSLNTVFDSLNRINAVIHSSLLGRKEELETIRHIIGSDLKVKGEFRSIQEYLDRIREAFLISQRGFQLAARAEAERILAALDPDKIGDDEGGIFRFGAFRKAERFDTYREKHGLVRKWVASGRFTEDLLRAFESICRKEYGKHIKEMP